MFKQRMKVASTIKPLCDINNWTAEKKRLQDEL
jgi:hypothetical protein